MVVRLTEKARARPDPIAIRGPPPDGQAEHADDDFRITVPNWRSSRRYSKEIFADTKRIFIDSPSEVFVKGTGGEQFFFVKQKGLEDAVQRISQEIRSQYLISYQPNNAGEPGYHRLVVVVESGVRHQDPTGLLDRRRQGAIALTSSPTLKACDCKMV